MAIAISGQFRRVLHCLLSHFYFSLSWLLSTSKCCSLLRCDVHFILECVILKQTLSPVRTKIPRMRIEYVFEWVAGSVFHVGTS